MVLKKHQQEVVLTSKGDSRNMSRVILDSVSAFVLSGLGNLYDDIWNVKVIFFETFINNKFNDIWYLTFKTCPLKMDIILYQKKNYYFSNNIVCETMT